MNDSSHSHRITGQQARQLLDEATQGPWETGPGMDFMRSRVVFDTVTDGRGFTTSHVLADVTRPGDADLIAAAPALAETVAWQEHELRRVVATLTRERGEWIDQEEAAVEHDEHDEASEAGAMVEGLDRAIQLLRPLAWPAEEARP